MGEVDAVEMVIKMLNRAEGYKEYLAAQKKDEDKEISLITFYSGQRKALFNRKCLKQTLTESVLLINFKEWKETLS